jgi:hypothetical protein
MITLYDKRAYLQRIKYVLEQCELYFCKKKKKKMNIEWWEYVNACM